MKKIRTVLCTLFAILLCLPLATACGREKIYDSEGNEVTDPSKIIEISVWDSGLGTKFLNNLVEAFKSENKGIGVTVTPSSSQDTFYNTISAGARANSFDLYFTYGPKFRQYFEGQHKDKNYLEDLTSVFRSTAAGDSQTIESKFPEAMRETLKVGDKYYAGLWQASANGLTYNAAEFAKHPEWKLPNTTKELQNLALAIAESGNTPFVHVPGYWEYVWAVWWAQYDGVAAHQDFWTKDFFEYFNTMYKAGNWNQSADYVTPGVKKALDALYALVSPEGYTLNGSNTTDFSILQTQYLSGDAMMMATGGWLETEMAKNQSAGSQVADKDIRFMKVPVLSSVVDMLEIETDEELSAIVSYIDNGETGEKPASDADIAKVRAMRNITYTSGPEMNVFIPAYAEGKEVAKEFLKFVYSDAGTKIYVETTHVLPPWYAGDASALDVSEWSVFSKSHLELQKSANYIFKDFSHPIVYNTARANVFYDTPESKFTAAYANDRETVTAFLSREIGQLSKDWAVFLSASGLK